MHEGRPTGDNRLAIARDILTTEPSMSIGTLERTIRELSRVASADGLRQTDPLAHTAFNDLLIYLNSGQIRSAEPIISESGEKVWQVNEWVKEGIVRVGFRLGVVTAASGEEDTLRFSDKDTLPTHPLNDAIDRNIRVVPGGSSIRAGSYLGNGVIMMPPSYVNIGAYVDDGTMIDSHALVGSCAQVGKRGHISAGSIIGGVLEPANARPCIVGDDVRMLGGSQIYEGVRLEDGVVLAAGVVLTASKEVWERKKDGTEVLLPNSPENPVVIPERSLVIPVPKIILNQDGSVARFGRNVSLIVKRYSQGGNPMLALNEALRS